MLVTIPHSILDEFKNCHELSCSSEPLEYTSLEGLIANIQESPFIPSTLNMSGVVDWSRARDDAIVRARSLYENVGDHYSIRRLIAAFLWRQMVVTATDWGNFFTLQNELNVSSDVRTIGHLMQEALETSQASAIEEGQWHLPLIQPSELDFYHPKIVCKISAARCNLIGSQTNEHLYADLFGDVVHYTALALHRKVTSFEHVATPNFYVSEVGDFGDVHSPQSIRGSYFNGWKTLRETI